MKEIKYRFWDDKKKKMVYGPTNGNPSASWVLAAASAYDLPVMLYTGLKDENKKEIWEGDILDAKGTFEVVTYYEGAFLACLPGLPKSGRNLSNKRFSYISRIVNVVIGNIYENPELLEKKHTA